MDNEATSKEKSTQEKCNKYEGVKDKRQGMYWCVCVCVCVSSHRLTQNASADL